MDSPRRTYAVLDQAQAGSVAETRDGFLDDLYELGGDVATPRFAGGIVAGAILTLVFLKYAGFRFSFGVGLGSSS